MFLSSEKQGQVFYSCLFRTIIWTNTGHDEIMVNSANQISSGIIIFYITLSLSPVFCAIEYILGSVSTCVTDLYSHTAPRAKLLAPSLRNAHYNKAHTSSTYCI